MTTEVAPPATLLRSAVGETVRFADGLIRYKVTGDETHGHLALAEARAPRGSGSPVHILCIEDEAWYILEGGLMFGPGEESRSAATGDFATGPRGVRNRFRVDSETAHFLVLVTPAGFEDFTRAYGWPATGGNLPPPDVPPLGEREPAAARRRHGTAIASP